MTLDRRAHGILSLLPGAAAVLVAAFAIFLNSPAWAGFYLASAVLSSLVIVMAFCAKCPCRNAGCGHVIPGMMTRYLPARVPGPYSAGDLAGVAGPAALLVLFPLYWLLWQPVLFLLFVVLLAASAADIRIAVCKGCTNGNCPVHPARNP